MNETINKILDGSAAVKAAIAGGIMALLIGVYFLMFFQDTAEELTKVEDLTKTVKLEIAEKQRVVANLPKFEAEVARLDVELKKALSELPDDKEIPRLLEKIADKAKEAGLDVRLFRPKPENRKDFYAEVPVEIEVGGGFHQVATFFDEVAHLDRIVNVDQFSMTDPKRGQNELIMKTSLTANSFRFLSEAERPKVDEKGAGKRRKKKTTAAKEDE